MTISNVPRADAPSAQSGSKFWQASPYWVPYVAVAVAIIPAYRGFVAKTAKQLRHTASVNHVSLRTLFNTHFHQAYQGSFAKALPKATRSFCRTLFDERVKKPFKFGVKTGPERFRVFLKDAPRKVKESFVDGVKAAPSTALIIGTQIVAQEYVETLFTPEENPEGGKNKPTLFGLFASTVIVATCSSPLLAWFNGRTMKLTFLQSIKGMSRWEFGAIFTRETTFIGALQINDRVSAAAKEKFGDNKAVGYGSAFAGGVVGSFCGHIPDTLLTRWQKKLSVSPSQWFWGVSERAIGVGTFTTCFSLVKSGVEPTKEKSPSK